MRKRESIMTRTDGGRNKSWHLPEKERRCITKSLIPKKSCNMTLKCPKESKKRLRQHRFSHHLRKLDKSKLGAKIHVLYIFPLCTRLPTDQSRAKDSELRRVRCTCTEYTPLHTHTEHHQARLRERQNVWSERSLSPYATPL